MKKIAVAVTVLFAIFASLFSFGNSPVLLDGDVVSIQVGTTIEVIRNASAGMLGTEILQKGQSFILSMVRPDNSVAWVLIDKNGANTNSLIQFLRTMSTGGVSNTKTYLDLKQFLVAENGWSVSSPGALPTALQLSATYTLSQLVRFASIARMTLVVMPVGIGDVSIYEVTDL